MTTIECKTPNEKKTERCKEEIRKDCHQDEGLMHTVGRSS